MLARLEQAGGKGAPGVAALGLRTSMRNQFPCAVGAVRPHQGLVRVKLVLALCKATAVQVARTIAPSPTLNVPQGVVTRAARAAQGGEIGLRLPGGVQLVRFAAAGHGLKTGQAAMACMDEAGVVIAASG